MKRRRRRTCRSRSRSRGSVSRRVRGLCNIAGQRCENLDVFNQRLHEEGTMTRRWGLLCLLAVLLWISTGVSGQDRAGSSRQPSTATGDWSHYAADMRGTKYSPLDQIDASNFGKLEVAWRFKTDILGPHPEYKLEGTPLAINGVLYATGGTRRSIVALDG